MFLLVLTIVYLVLHLALYVLVFRNVPAFGQERTIFLYHAVPALVLTLVVVLAIIVTRDPTTLAAGVLALSLQGLYSLSFLELWALSDAGYSLQILEHVATTRTSFDASGMKDVGAGKRSDRLKAALDLGLVSTDGETFALTKSGRVVAAVFAAIVWLVNAKLK
jgi:hypothetical protein